MVADILRQLNTSCFESQQNRVVFFLKMKYNDNTCYNTT